MAGFRFNSCLKGTFLGALIFSVALISCTEDSSLNNPQENTSLVSATLVYSASSSDIKLLAQLAGFSLDVSKFANDVDLYKVTYNTTYNGAAVIASGLISLPKAAKEFPMISFQHGTILKDSEAPSNFQVQKAETLIGATLASSGLITVIPDYLGFGSSVSIVHPYFLEDVYATTVIDMLKAAKELAENNGITFNSKLFLAGYSEGGYATMATHKAIEENDLDDFDLVASFPGAGAYDLQSLQQVLLKSEDYDSPFYLAYIALAYQLNYNFTTLLTDFFKEPYAAKIPGLFDHQKGSGEINGELTTHIPDLIQPDLANKILTDPAYAYLKQAFDDNSLIDWAPKKKMYMYHGTSDKTVPFENSVATFEALKANGASTDIVSLTPLPGDHSSAVTPYVADLLIKLFDLK